MTLDHDLQALKRKAEETPFDPNAWASYIGAMERTGQKPAKYLSDKINTLAQISKSIILAKSAGIEFPVWPFHVTNEQSPINRYRAFQIVEINEGDPRNRTAVFLLQNEGLYRFDGPQAHYSDHLCYTYSSKREHIVDYLTYGVCALNTIS